MGEEVQLTHGEHAREQARGDEASERSGAANTSAYVSIRQHTSEEVQLMLREHASGDKASEVVSSCHTSRALRARGEVASERSGDPADVASERRGAMQARGELEAEAREEESQHQRKLREQPLTSIAAETRETVTVTEGQTARAETDRQTDRQAEGERQTDRRSESGETETERQRERAEEVQRRLREQALKSMLLRRKQQAAAAAAAAAAGGILPL